MSWATGTSSPTTCSFVVVVLEYCLVLAVLFGNVLLTMEVPEVAVRWMAQHASSNLDLASLSNVNRQWRSITTATLLSSPSSLLLPSMISTILTQNSITVTANDKNNTFCAAWFPPAGIQIQQMDNGHGGEERVGEEESDSFAPSGSLSYAGSEEGQGPSLSAINFHELEEGTICSHEWRGYREDMDVLAPFGYAAAFVEVSRHAVNYA